MNLGDWISPIISPRKNFNIQIKERHSVRDNWSGASDSFEREVRVSSGKYEINESRKYSADIPRLKTNKARKIESKKKLAIGKQREPKMMRPRGNPPSEKVEMDIYLERFDRGGVFITKVRVGNRVRWQNVKYEKQALRYHSAIKRLQTVMSAVDAMRDHRTLRISLTKDEAERYKAGDLLEGTSKQKPKSETRPTYQQVNNYFQQNNYGCSAGPSTLHCIEDNNDEFDSIYDFESDSD